MAGMSVTSASRQKPRANLSIPSLITQTSPTTTSPPKASPPNSRVSTLGVRNSSVRITNSPIRLDNPPPRRPAPIVTNAATLKLSMAASVISPETPATGLSGPASPVATQAGSKMSMTTKEWVVPPRPKPGRKPATDTPPTKRKAQNRAAQRAFRERRAARVGELEEQLEEYREERDKVEKDLKEKIRQLELELESFRSKCSLLEKLLEQERQERGRVQTELGSLRRAHGTSYEGNHPRTASISSAQDGQRYLPQDQHNLHFNQQQISGVGTRIPLGNERSSSNEQQPMNGFPISQIVSPPDPMVSMNDADLTCGNCQPSGPCACAEEALRSVQEDDGCGKCAFGGACQCIEETIQAVAAPLPGSKRAFPPLGTESQEKRIKPNNSAQPFADISTPISSHTPSQPPRSATSPRPAPKDTCGFCDDGTYCVCADAANLQSTGNNTMGSVFSHETQVPSPPAEVETVPPPPMEITSSGAVKLPPRGSQRRKRDSRAVPTPSGCGNAGPGTCKQCLEDPQSGLFCRTLASLNEGGCCGGNAGGGGCCKTKGSSQGGGRPITINCAETYKTLSSHRNFDRAFEDLGTWLPKLRVVPQKDEAATAGRPAVEIDAASIMSTLKFLDVRFGSSGN